MTTAKRVKTFWVELEDQPGSMAKLMTAFREARNDLLGTWAWTESGNKARVICVGKNPTETEKVIKGVGLRYTPNEACFCEGDDRLGIYQELLGKIAAARINMDACCATATAGKFSALMMPKEGLMDKLCHVLGC